MQNLIDLEQKPWLHYYTINFLVDTFIKRWNLLWVKIIWIQCRCAKVLWLKFLIFIVMCIIIYQKINLPIPWPYYFTSSDSPVALSETWTAKHLGIVNQTSCSSPHNLSKYNLFTSNISFIPGLSNGNAFYSEDKFYNFFPKSP